MRFIAFAFVLVLAVATLAYIMLPEPYTGTGPGITNFRSTAEFQSYISTSQSYFGTSASMPFYGFNSMGVARTLAGTEQGPLAPMIEDYGAEPSRVSETNVQVAGIDEPDIVKTDGSEIYFSTYGYRVFWAMESYYYPYYSGRLNVIDAFPPDELGIDSQMNISGDLLLYNDTLVVFSYDTITGYDVSDPESPEQSWEIALDSSIIGARLYGDKIYLITMKYIDTFVPCPVTIMEKDDVSVAVPCLSVWHPIAPEPSDITYNIAVIDPVSGDVEDTVSFLGSSGASMLYMSGDAIYVTYPIYPDTFEVYYDMIRGFTDLLPADVMDRLDRLNSYDISSQSKLNELYIIIGNYFSALQASDIDAYNDIMDEFTNRTVDYFSEHKRDFVKTGIIKVGLDMEILGTADFPGNPLNQFSFDEYDGYLRVATTVVDMNSWSWSDWANDIYIFDSDMNMVGSITDIGLEERIYSARFVADKGYLVTFRQTDPFFVLDLSDPENPSVAGELEIPGYSSYLHPIDDDTILGIGMEDQNVKLSLFDVSSPDNPAELSHYELEEYWSDVLNTHHAFLLDEQHEIFFMPGGSSGYVFSYANDTIELVKSVSDIAAMRAIYIDDYLYVIGDAEVVVLDENTWEEVSSLKLEE